MCDNDTGDTWAFLTQFVCRYDELDQAKARHQRCVEVLKEHTKVHFSSEQAFQVGLDDLLFKLLLPEIVGFGPELTPEEEEEYSLFMFVTIAELPEVLGEDGNDTLRDVAARLEIDFEEGIPARFPSRTRGIRVSSSGGEVKGCIYQ